MYATITSRVLTLLRTWNLPPITVLWYYHGGPTLIMILIMTLIMIMIMAMILIMIKIMIMIMITIMVLDFCLLRPGHSLLSAEAGPT